MLEQRRSCEADESSIGQRQAHVARQLARLSAVGLVRDHDNVIPVAVGLALLHILVEFVNQAEHITMVFLEQLLQHPA